MGANMTIRIHSGIQVYLSRYRLHALHDEADVFVQIDPQFLGALDDVLAIHVLGKAFIAHQQLVQ